MSHDFDAGEVATVNLSFAVTDNIGESLQHLSHDLEMVNKYCHSNNPQVEDLLDKIKVILELTRETKPKSQT